MKCDILIQFGKHVKDLRTERNLSQSELAFKVNFNRNYIGMIERGERNPSLKSLHRLARALDVTLSQLMDFKCDDYDE